MSRADVPVRALRPLVVALAAMLLMVLAAQSASAHETREVDGFTFVVGFLNEPAFAGIPNGVSLSITETESEEPFVDLTDTLEVDVTFGDETMTMTMSPAFRVGVFGTPGEYNADFVPSRPGVYEFRFHGTVGDVEVDETFVSGPDTFDEVQSVAEASFPVQDPSTGELAELLERETARLNERIDELESSHGDESASADAEEDVEEVAGGSDSTARALGVGALLLGAGALGTAVLARRKT
jgi:hypothetical protein